MRSRFSSAALAVAAIVGGSGAAHAGAWTQEQGAFYAKAWNRSLLGTGDASRAYFVDGDSGDIGQDYTDHALNLYGEYGLTGEWTVVAHGAVVGRATVGDESVTYVGPLTLGVRKALLTGDLRVAVEARGIHAPAVGDGALAEGVADGRGWLYAPTIAGSGGHAELQLGRGTGFGWWTASVGGSYLSAQGVGASLNATAQLGWRLSDSLYLPLTLGLIEPLEELEVTNVSGAGRTRYLGFDLGVSWWLTERVGLNAGVGGVFYASSNAATPSLMLGIELR